MKKLSNDEKISLIQKYYKKDSTFLEMSLTNYEEYNLYICLNKITKTNSYRLSWFDLDNIADENIEKYLSCQYIHLKTIDSIKKYFSEVIASSIRHEETTAEDYIVKLKVNTPTQVDKKIDVSFRKYLPISLFHLLDLVIFIFKSISKGYEEILFELMANFTKSTQKYEYKKEFDFNLFKGDIDKLFSYQIGERGKKYYEESKVKFLEKIDDRYFAVVEGTEKYLTIIKYKEDEEKMQVYCSCPCEFYCKHMYAVILVIRNKKTNHFYKIIYNNPEKDLLDRITNSDYFLCIGVFEKYLQIINNYGEIELVPIIDSSGKCNWQIIEDSEDKKLSKEIKKILDN